MRCIPRDVFTEFHGQVSSLSIETITPRSSTPLARVVIERQSSNLPKPNLLLLLIIDVLIPLLFPAKPALPAALTPPTPPGNGRPSRGALRATAVWSPSRPEMADGPAVRRWDEEQGQVRSRHLQSERLSRSFRS